MQIKCESKILTISITKKERTALEKYKSIFETNVNTSKCKYITRMGYDAWGHYFYKLNVVGLIERLMKQGIYVYKSRKYNLLDFYYSIQKYTEGEMDYSIAKIVHIIHKKEYYDDSSDYFYNGWGLIFLYPFTNKNNNKIVVMKNKKYQSDYDCAINTIYRERGESNEIRM